ncbi:MAG: ASKHA domain-containing protein [Kiritimatiellales bacterium]|nr:ASKHA domain-containing protein [Kiritimatiellales bacterium]
MAVIINFEGRSVAVESGSDRSVLDLAREAGWHIDAKCGGKGFCASCNVLLGAGHYRVFAEEIEVLPEQRREVLACQTVVLSETAEIFIPRSSVIALDGARIADEMEIPEHTLNPRFGEGFGIAVDVGTTTVVAALVDLSTGKVVSRESLYNQQILKADDVVSRISLCDDDANLKILQELVIEHTLNPLIQKLCAGTGTDKEQIVQLAVSGNTVMMHIFFGVSPVSIGVIPFKPVSLTFESIAVALGIDVKPDAVIAAVPAISGYVGGDITSDIFVSNLWNQNGLTVLIDIGTNGEMVACHAGQMTACATAAGPAFEGAGLLHGARAASRAIDTINYDETLQFELTVIGEPYPMGLCGSAIIDFIACGFRCGLINAYGRYDVEMLKAQDCHETVCGMHACILVDTEQSATGETITVTEHDIAEILKAKAAIYAGLKTLLAELGKTVQEIDCIILAGGFAKHINLENAVTIGLLPDIGIEKYKVIGNGSLAGAALALLDQGTGQAYLDIIDKPKVITLNQTAHFTNYFQEALALPNLDESDFPNILSNH